MASPAGAVMHCAPVSAKITFFIDRIEAVEPRSKVEDTVFVLATLRAGATVLHSPPTQVLYMVGGNAFDPHLQVGPIDVDANSPPSISFQVVNAGGVDVTKMRAALEKVGSDMTKDALAGQGFIWSNLAAFGVAQAIGALVDFLAQSCNGVLAADALGSSFGRMWMVLEGSGSFSEQRTYNGYDSPGLVCNHVNSVYRVHFRAEQTGRWIPHSLPAPHHPHPAQSE